MSGDWTAAIGGRDHIIQINIKPYVRRKNSIRWCEKVLPLWLGMTDLLRKKTI